jgi:hypothetical protein
MTMLLEIAMLVTSAYLVASSLYAYRKTKQTPMVVVAALGVAVVCLAIIALVI